MSLAVLVRYVEDGILQVVKKCDIRKCKRSYEAKYSDGYYYTVEIVKEGGKIARA